MNKETDYKLVILFSILMLLTTITVVAQVKLDSPYSRFGLGDINPGYNVFQSSMGGVSYGVIDPYRISTINPASYSKIDTGSFVFNAAFNGLFVNTKTDAQENNANYFNMDYLKFALPITGWWRTSGGLLPYSTVGYDLNTYTNVDSIGGVRLGYSGNGGITEVYWGNAFTLFNGFAVGANISYMFGNVNIAQESELQEHSTAFKYRIKNTVDLRSVYFDFGVQYDTRFGKDNAYFLGLGMVYAPEQSLKTTSSSLGITYTGGGEGFEYIKDTVLLVDKGTGSVVMPMKFGGGFSIGKTEKWMIAFDATYEEFSKFEISGIEQDYNDNVRYNIGGQYFIGKFALNVGANMTNSFLRLNETDINEFGISFGMGFPLKSTKTMVSYIDLGIEAGRRGTTENNLIEQDYLRVKLGINIRNTWFRRPKYL